MSDTENKTAEEKHVDRFETEARTIGPCKVEVSVRIPVETIALEFDDRFKELIKTVAFPGFRIGHAPRRLVERKLGDDVRSEVKENLVSASFKEAVEKHEIDAIANPDVDLESVELTDGKPMEYKVVFLVRPTVNLPDFAAITVPAARAEVSEARVEVVLEAMRRRHSVLEPRAGEKLAAGDVAMVDVVAKVGDDRVVERENCQYEHPEPFLAGLHLPGFKDLILGKGADDRFVLTEKLPDTWPQKDHAGKEMAVEVVVREVKRHVLPPLDDAFAGKLDYDTLAELTEDIRKKVARDAEHEAVETTDRRIVDALLAASPFELPVEMLMEETVGRVKRLQARLRIRGATEEEMERKIAEASNAARAEAERDLRAAFLLEAIAKKQKVLVTETEVHDRIEQIANANHRTVKDMEEYLEQRDMLASIRTQMREEKVMEFLRKTVKVEPAA